MRLQYRRLTARIAAIDVSSYAKPIALQLEPGAVVRVLGAPRESGLVDITSDGRAYEVFYADLIERSEAVAVAAG